LALPAATELPAAGMLFLKEVLIMKIGASVFLTAALLGSAALPARAETIDVYDNHGGRVVEYNARWAGYAQRGVSVRVIGPCKSACTILIGHIPRNRICVTPAARFGFHLAKLPHATAMIWNAYPEDIKGWINARGGLQRDFHWMRAPDTFRYFKRC
jgi:hypothetical protein